MIRCLAGDAREVVAGLPPGSVDCVITDPVWPNAPNGMFPECPDPHGMLRGVLDALPGGVKRLAIVMRNDCDPRFLTAVPERWPFFHAVWFYFALPSRVGRHLGGAEIGWLFGDPPPSRPGFHLVPSMCDIAAQPIAKSGHPSPRQIMHTAWLVSRWSAPGETILDPFSGSGTTGLAADHHGRDAILVDINPRYAEMGAKRIRDENPLFARVSTE